MEKRCIICGIIKPLDLFYVHGQMKDGHLNKCIDCCKSYALQHRQENIDKIKEYDRNRPNAVQRKLEKRERERLLKLENPDAYRQKRKEVLKRYADSHKEQEVARRLVHKALINGTLCPPGLCSMCHKNAPDHAHHEDYDKPLEVIWLCTECHGKRHKEINAEKRRNQCQTK